MSTVLRLSPTVLDWAAAQLGRTLGELARQISKRSAEDIVAGKVTTAQAIKIAKAAGIPFGYLFLDQPPAPRRSAIADFRTTPQAAPLSKDYFDVYDDLEQKQVWYREQLIASGADELPFVGKFSGRRVSPELVASDMRAVLKFNGTQELSLTDPDDLFSLLAARSESVGVLVFKNSVVGNNTRRPISIHEYRGFCLSDKYAPVVFVNGADAPAAWAFTLMHELAHIWLGESAISDTAPNSTNAHERFCNRVAAEFLVPTTSFAAIWNATIGDYTEKIDAARRHFKVSGLVVALRALHLNLLQPSEFADFSRSHRGKRAREAGGGDFYRTLATRNSKRFSRYVSEMAVSGNISLRDAGRLLNVNPNFITTFHAKQSPLPV